MNSSYYHEKAIGCYENAEKVRKAFNPWKLLKPSQDQDAATLYSEAGNLYKLALEYESAASSFFTASTLLKKPDYKLEYMQCLYNAASCYDKFDYEKAIELYQELVELHLHHGNLRQAGKVTRKMAELFEKNNKLEQAQAYYDKSSNLFINENQPSSAIHDMLCMANILIEMKEFDKASSVYWKIIQMTEENNLSKWSLTNYIFTFLLCKFASHTMTTQLDECVHNYAMFESSRECKLLQVIQKGILEDFVAAMNEYDQISRLKKMETILLWEIKNRMIQSPEEPDFS